MIERLGCVRTSPGPTNRSKEAGTDEGQPSSFRSARLGVMAQARIVTVGEPVQPLQVFNSVICGGGSVLLCDLRPLEAHEKGFISSAIHIPPPASPGAGEEPHRADGGSSTSLSNLMGQQQQGTTGWPASIADIEAASKDELARKRLGQRSLRSVIVYESGDSPKLSAWAKHVLKLFKRDGKVMGVAVLQGGYRAFIDRYPFTIQTDPAGMNRSYPNEIISGRLYLGTLQHALDMQVITDLQITHCVNAANSIGRETFAADLGVRYMYVDVVDDDDEDLLSFFRPVYDFIDDAIGQETVMGPDGQMIKNQRRVLVHCQLGVSRSAALSIFYVMCKKRCSLVKAFDHVQKSRPQICPNMGFRKQLRQAELDLFQVASISQESLEFLGEEGWEPQHDEIRRHPCNVM